MLHSCRHRAFRKSQFVCRVARDGERALRRGIDGSGIAAGIIKLGRASIRNLLLGAILIGSFVGMRFGGVNFLLILIMAGTYPGSDNAEARRA